MLVGLFVLGFFPFSFYRQNCCFPAKRGGSSGLSLEEREGFEGFIYMHGVVVVDNTVQTTDLFMSGGLIAIFEVRYFFYPPPPPFFNKL